MGSAEYWIKHLDLRPHTEGGFFTETYRSKVNIEASALPIGYTGDRRTATSIYYLLRSEDIRKMHRIKSDELWYFHQGSPMKVHSIDCAGKKTSKILGSNPTKAEKFYIEIPANTIFAAEVMQPDSFSLVSCVVSPGFEYEDFELFGLEDLEQTFPQHSELFKRFCE